MRDLEYFERRLMETLAELKAMTKERDELKVENELLKQHGRAWREQAEGLAQELGELEKDADLYLTSCAGKEFHNDYTLGRIDTYAWIKECVAAAIKNYAAFKKERGEL